MSKLLHSVAIHGTALHSLFVSQMHDTDQFDVDPRDGIVSCMTVDGVCRKRIRKEI